ncbi:PHD finger protein MBD-R2 isoform X2 [Anticarsia gemmatalis]|uniref:PHD finger protein MBD-R2 isoform X2 n=1 Tax=Anticarsia gemmatalis TaxID=129554 RepID=UPI003F76AA79
MAVKKCCIDNCKSCSTRKEDKGVTYHKFPKDISLRDIWMSKTHKIHIGTDSPMYVCSRHFYKNDFQMYKDSKYVLRSDAVPSIFPWCTLKDKKEMESKSQVIEPADDSQLTSTSVMESDIECVDSIKKFIEEQEKEIQERRLRTSPSIDTINNDSVDSKISQCENMPGSYTDMTINDSDLEIAEKKSMESKIMSPSDKIHSSMALSVGSRVEAKDFGGEWHCAEITEVDYDEMEVLVHYENDTKKHDEWISVSSPRLRPVGSSTVKPGPSSIDTFSTDSNSMPSTSSSVKDEPKLEEKEKPTFVVGERCLARWRDNRRFVATIRKDLENGSYEIVFDDGCPWTCKASRLYKLKPEKEVLNGSESPPARPIYPTGPTTMTLYPAYHTHLFDPTRDYLGSKSERREMKRKLNIKEIFNIGQKRPKTVHKDKAQKPVAKKPRIIKKSTKIKTESVVKPEVKSNSNAASAVASIIGTVGEEKPEVKDLPIDNFEDVPKEEPMEVTEDNASLDDNAVELNVTADDEMNSEFDKVQLEDLKPFLDPEPFDEILQVLEEEVELEKFEKPDEVQHEEVIDRIKEVINKLEDGINQATTSSPKPDIKFETPTTETEPKYEVGTPETSPEKKNKRPKAKKGKKLRHKIRETNVKQQVEKVKSELEVVRRQMEEMRKQMFLDQEQEEKPASCLLPGEWCCKWVNGQPVGTVSEIECEVKQPDPTGKAPLPRRSVQVEDNRLPEGWTKHMVRRSLGHSAGKWDVVLVNPDNRRFHTKNEMRIYLENNPDKNLQAYEHALTDFGVHLKLARRMHWITRTPDGLAHGPDSPLPAGTLPCTSPLIKRRSLGLKRKDKKIKNKIPKLTIKMKPSPETVAPTEESGLSTAIVPTEDMSAPAVDSNPEQFNTPTLEDGYVFVGSLKVQIIENLLRCPAEGCVKNFRNNTLLQMHIKHYHRELRKMMGATPKVLDLAYARTMPGEIESPKPKDDQKIIKVKIPRPPKPKVEKEEPKLEIKLDKLELPVDMTPTTPVREPEIIIPRSQDSPKLRQALINKPVKRPRVLLPVRRVEPEPVVPDPLNDDIDLEGPPLDPMLDVPMEVESMDYEAAISTHTVTKPLPEKKRKGEKKKKTLAPPPKGPTSEEDDWYGMNSDDVETRSSFPRSGTPDSKVEKTAPVSSESNEENKDSGYMYNENGERVKIEHMKREEIINCHCGYRDEDGLMVQCELCLCWQHALCHNIQRATDVPEGYTCSTCLWPRRGRRGARHRHAQERLYAGALAGAAPCDALRRSHELTGNLLRLADALHAMRIKCYVASKKNHPKLYLWAQDWEQGDIQYSQEKLAADYSDLNMMINSMDKENLPLKPDEKEMPIEIRTEYLDDLDSDRFSQRDGTQSLLSGLLSSPSGTSLELPISASDLEQLAKSVEEQESPRPAIVAPQPEAAIENDACRERLWKHLQRCQSLIDARLDSIEAQIVELESQDPSFVHEETPKCFPRTKQTIQMLIRDLNTMEDLGVIT